MSGTPEVDVERLIEFLVRNRGVDLRPYKRGTLTRRIQRRLDARGVTTIDAYLDVLELDADEIAALLDSVLINVTAFFRDTESWDHLRGQELPEIVGPAGTADPIRVWSAGCSTGEEAYSLAIALCEELGDLAFIERVKIFATDVDDAALAAARAGTYPRTALDQIPPEVVDRYFEFTAEMASFRADLRPNLIFGRHNLLEDPPISRLDLLVCRNTLMYFNAEAQERVLRRFKFALKPTGVLFLGRAEMLTTRTNLFTPVDIDHRIFRATPADPATTPVATPDPGAATVSWAQLGELDFEAHPAAHVVIDAEGTLALANERARATFGLGAADVGRPLRELPLSFRPIDLLPRIDVARTERRTVTVAAVPHERDGSRRSFYDVVITPLGAGPVAVGITWLDTTAAAELREQLVQLAQERETTAEELQSANEELETTNEELQSTNEELETINEELQSTNEELQSINLQLRRSSAERDRASAFLEAILTSLHQAVVVLDADLVVQAWNSRAAELWGLRPEEVVGTSARDIDTGFPIDALGDAIAECLAGRSSFESTDLPVTNRRGRTFTARATLSPLHDPSSGSDGVVVLVEEVG